MQAINNITGKTGGRAYWLFQLTFWLLLVLPDLLTLQFRSTALDSLWSFGSLAMAFLASHLAHEVAQGRRWFDMPAGKMISRLTVVVLVIASLCFVTGFAERSYQSEATRHFLSKPGVILSYWLGALLMACAWAGCYLALNEWQLRRDLALNQLRMQLAWQQAQLDGLRAQLNPHFLFNALNTLRELFFEDPRGAREIITQLSTLLRYSLRLRGSDMAPFSEELEVVEGYVAIERARYEDRLHVRWEVDRSACDARVPPMLLQSLVENAVKHGIAGRSDGTEVIIRAHRTGLDLRLEVLNSGALRPNSPDPGIGLRNTQERLRLLYGDHASFLLENTAAGYVRAQVILPAESSPGATR